MRLTSFSFNNQTLPVSFIETVHVTDGVECDVYAFDNDSIKDLGIIRVHPGCRTPLQRVLKGEKTIEGFVSGNGTLTITKLDGNSTVYRFDEKSKGEPVVVAIGETMQWQATQESELIAYEICFPPYQDGRYENL